MPNQIILWLSRHRPTRSQIAELTRLFPGHELRIDSRTFESADTIVERYKRSGATEMVVVAPLSFVRELVKRGLHPLWAEMRQVTRGSPDAEASNNGRHYRFVKFHRIKSVKVTLEEVHPPSPTKEKEISSTPVNSALGDTSCNTPNLVCEPPLTSTKQ